MPSFDIVSKLESHEVDNAIAQASREVAQRFDFKDTFTEIERNQDGIQLRSASEGRIEAALTALKEKLVKRNVSLKSLDPQKIEPSAKGHFRQLIKLKEGISQEAAKDIVKRIKESKLKVQAAIQADQVRVTGKKRDDLQEAIAFLKTADLDLDLQFNNFRD